MSRAGEIIPMAIPIFNLLWWAGSRIAKRVRARRAGKPLPVDMAAVREGIDRAADLARRDAVHDRLTKASGMFEEFDGENTPRERPHKGTR
jgi:hypothetical protein